MHGNAGVVGVGVAMAVCAQLVGAQQPDSLPAIYRVQPSQLRIPGRDSGVVLGYPAVSVDKGVVRGMLRAREFGALDQYFTQLQDATKAHIQREYDLVDASRVFASADSTLGPLIGEWIVAAPTSAHARTARATWYLSKAWYARGTQWASQTSASSFEVMARYARLAAEDAVTALQMDSTEFIAYSELLGVLNLQGDKERERAVFAASWKVFPGSYYLPHVYMNSLEPRWGGSYAAMAAFASEMAADSGINPRLRTLLGAVEADRADMAIIAGDFDEAVRHADAALRFGPEFYYLVQRGHAHVHFTDNGRGIADLNVALSRRPQYAPALEYHGVAALSSADYSVGGEREAALRQAIHDFESILAFDPVDRDALRGLKDATFELKTCPDKHAECGGSEAGPLRVFIAVWRDFKSYLAYLGVLVCVSWWGFIKWARSGFWLPRYLHLLAFLALLLVCYADFLWVRTGAPMTLRRWILIPFFPGSVYLLFVGLGGASWGRRR